MGEHNEEKKQDKGFEGNNAEPKLDNVSLNVDPQPEQPDVNSTSPSTSPSEVPSEKQVEDADQLEKLAKKLTAVFVVSSGLAIFLWFMAGAGYPWFIYVVYAVGLLDCIIYGVKQKKWFFINWTIYASTNAMLFLTFLASGGGYPWFMIPACSMSILPICHYCAIKFQSPLRWLYIHAAIYTIINTMLFFIWMVNSRHNPYPWFIYSWSGWGVGLLIQYNATVMHNNARLFIFICADIGCMLLITFRFAIGPIFIVFVGLAALAAILYFIFLKKGYVAHCWCMKRNQVTPTTTDLPPQPQVPEQQQQMPPNFIPQYPQQMQVPYQAAPAMYPPPGAHPQMNMIYPPNVSGYYAYFPNSEQRLYPTIYNMNPPQVPAPAPVGTVPVPVPVPAPNAAVLSTDIPVVEKSNNEGSYLLRNSK